MSTLEALTGKNEMSRMWVHESRRVYRDKLVDLKDMQQYDLLEKEITNKVFDVSPIFSLVKRESSIYSEPIILYGADLNYPDKTDFLLVGLEYLLSKNAIIYKIWIAIYQY